MRRYLATGVYLGLVSAIACERENTPPSPGAAPSVASATVPTAHSGAPRAAVPPLPVAAESPSESPPAGSAGSTAHCLSPAEVEAAPTVHFKLDTDLSVVRVAPDDALHVRERPGAGEKPIGKLAHDSRGIRATRRACRVDKSIWLEVTKDDTKGWVNGSFLMATTEPADETARFSKLLGNARHRTAEELVKALRTALVKERDEPSEVLFDPQLVGISREKGLVALLYVCCFADDSLMGQQVWLELAEEKDGVTLRRARVSHLCWRGTTKNLCR